MFVVHCFIVHYAVYKVNIEVNKKTKNKQKKKQESQ